LLPPPPGRNLPAMTPAKGLSPTIPEQLNLADWFLADRLREGRGARIAIRTDTASFTYAEVDARANQYAQLLCGAGVQPEQRVIIAMDDGPEWVAAFFGILKLGAVVVMVNPQLKADSIEYFLNYTRATAAVVGAVAATEFRTAAGAAPHLRHVIETETDAVQEELRAAPVTFDSFPSHRDDAAIWLFSGGTTGKPKAVVQSHNSFVNTTLCYAHGVLGYHEDDITVSVPKLFFGYATGSNLLFPFSVGASVVLFADRCTPEVLCDQIERHRPTILINVPTLINKMLADDNTAARDLSSLRFATSAGEALPTELYERWKANYGVELLDGLGTAEQWHVFISNSPVRVKPGTLGWEVPGFEVRVRDDDGADVATGEVGNLWVRGNSRAIGYWQRMARTMQAFRGEWYVSGDMVLRDADGAFVYCGRGDDMLKVSGKWFAPSEVENCLLQHPAVRETAVVGVAMEGLMKPKAFVVAVPGVVPDDALADDLRNHVAAALDFYKAPRAIEFLDDFPRTHLGKINRAELKTR
jgi:benzoate-CoA ligase family protein